MPRKQPSLFEHTWACTFWGMHAVYLIPDFWDLLNGHDARGL